MFDRYARHRLIHGWNQERLSQARILVAGAGAVGNEVLKTLALVGVEQVLIVDFDTIEASNLSRGVLFCEGDVGRPKAEAAAGRMRELNPKVSTLAVRGDLEYDVGLGVYRTCDLVIGCLDSLAARVALSRICRRAGVPWLNTGIEVSEAEVTLFGGVEEDVCFACGLSEEMWARIHERHSCGGLRRDAPSSHVPTTDVIASLAAGYAVNEALAYLHAGEAGDKTGLHFGQKLYLTLRPYALHVQTLSPNPACPDHQVWNPVEMLEASTSELTPMGLLHAAGAPDGVLELGFDLLTRMHCLACGVSEEILRPVERCAERLSRCPECGRDEREPLTVHRLDAASEFAHRSLAAIGVPEHQVLAVKEGGIRRYLQVGGAFRFRG